MKLSIIIVNWNSADYVRQCLRSIFGLPPKFTFEVIVIDNGSFDSCNDMINREFPGVIFLQCDNNMGFARANNEAARHAKGDALLFLNPDTEVQAGALERLVEALQSHEDAGVVGARLLNSDGTLQATSIQAFPTLLNQLLDADVLRNLLPKLPLWRTAALEETTGVVPNVEAISGACLLTSRRVYDQLGGLNETFFMYSEDTDYCFISRRAGFMNYYVPDAVVIHHGGKSSGGSYSKFASVMLVESGRRFFRQRHGSVQAILFGIVVQIKAILRLLALLGLYPVMRIRDGSSKINEGIQKWWGILRWTVGLEKGWIQSFDVDLRSRIHSVHLH